MALANRVKMTVSGTPGTGTVTLLAAVTNFLTFAQGGIANAATTTYEIIESGVGWEIGRGTYTTAGTTLSRDTVLITSAGNQTKISFTSAATVFVVAAAEDVPLPAATPAIVLGTAVASGSAITYLRSDATIVGNRAALPADARGWTFLGTATASTAVRTGTITWTGTWKQLMFEYFIAGYSNTAIGRILIGPTAGISETGTTFCASHCTGVGAVTTSVSIPGWPAFGGVADNVPRWGRGWIKNVAGEVKRMEATGMNAGTAPTTAPTLYQMAGLFNDTTNSVVKAEMAVYAAITGTAVSTTTFNAGTYITFWGRNDD